MMGSRCVNTVEELFARLARGQYPEFDGMTSVMPAPSGAVAAVLAFTGHHVVAADVDPVWVESRCPPMDLAAPLKPEFLLALGQYVDCEASSLRLVFCATGISGAPDLELREVGAEGGHPRVTRAHHYRTAVRVYETPDGQGLLTLGRGLGGRWEAGFEVSPRYRNRGLGRALVAASRYLIEPGGGLFMQTAIGNIASLRAILAGGFAPVGAEVLYYAEMSAG